MNKDKDPNHGVVTSVPIELLTGNRRQRISYLSHTVDEDVAGIKVTHPNDPQHQAAIEAAKAAYASTDEGRSELLLRAAELAGQCDNPAELTWRQKDMARLADHLRQLAKEAR